jgi:PhnB protein
MSITPHLVVQGADRAASFYRDAFGAEEIERIPTPDGRLMSLQLRIGDGMAHLADEFPEMAVLAPPSIGGTPVVLALADADAVFARAIAAGASVRQPLADMFWGDRHGQLEDPFGHRWNISHHVLDVPHADVVTAAMLAEQATSKMPAAADLVRGRLAIATSLAARPLVDGMRWRLVPTRVAGQLAFGDYYGADPAGRRAS